MSAKKISLIALGLIMGFGSIWGGGYIFHCMPENHWAEAPTLATLIVIGLCGYFLTAWAWLIFERP